LKPSQKTKLLIVGLDGAGFDVISPLIQSGRLPNLSKLLSQGAHGPLESTVHPLTPLAWTSFLTGKNPGKHGIFDFFARVENTYKFRLVTLAERSGRDFIDILSDADRRVVSLNVPLTYPPRPVNGAMVSGMGTPNLQVQFTYPPNLRKMILEKCPGYAIAPPYDRGRETIAKAVLRMAQAHTNAGLLLMGEFNPDLFVMVYGSTDIAQHLYWRDAYERGTEGTDPAFADLIARVYETADAGLGAFIERMGDVPVLILSDHGAQGLELAVGLNRFLADKGYLAFFPGGKPPPDMTLGKVVRSIARKSSLAIQRTLPKSIKEPLKRLLPGISHKLTALWNVPDMSAVDFSRTRAFAVGSYGSIFLNVKGREPQGVIEAGKQYEELCDEISAALLGWTTPGGNRVVDKVQRREELYQGPFVERAPDLIVRLQPGVFTRTSFAPEKEELYEGREHPMFVQKYQSIHAMYGICIASGHPFYHEQSNTSSPNNLQGKHIEAPNSIQGQLIEKPNAIPGQLVEGARIIDLAPTILHAMGLDIPDDMDGIPLKGLFDPEWYNANPPRITSGPSKPGPATTRKLSPEEEKKLKEELQGLGYIQ